MDPTFRSPLVTDLDVAMGFEPRNPFAAGKLRREADAALARSYADGVLDLGREAETAPLDEKVLWEMGRSLEESGAPVREVRLSGWKRPSDVALRALSVSVARTVQALDLSRSQADWETCRVLPARYFGLTAVDMSDCPRLVEDCLASVTKAASRTLTALDVSRCPGLGDDLFGWVSGSVGPSMGAGCKALLSVRASRTPYVRDRALGHLAEGCKQLRFLDVSHCGAITDEGVLALTKGCRQLQVVDLDSCDRLSDEAFRALGMRCRRLRSITAARLPLITDRALWYLSRGCRELQAVDVASCYSITEKGLYFLARECQLLQQLRCDGDSLVSAKGLSAVVRGLPRGETKLAEDWHGIQPTRQMPRLRLARSALYLRDAAALAIQCAGRAYIARHHTAVLRRKRALRALSNDAAGAAQDRLWRLYVSNEAERRGMRRACLFIQVTARRWLQRRSEKRRAARRAVEEAAGRRLDPIKAWLRGRRARLEHPEVREAIVLLRRARLAEAAGVAVLPLQCALRVRLARRKVAALRWERERRLRDREVAAGVLQRQWRAVMARREAHQLRAGAIAFGRAVLALAVTVQRLWRGHVGRCRAAWMRAVGYPLLRARQNVAAVRAQCAWRGYLGRLLAERRRAQIALEVRSARQIQRVWKGYRTPDWKEAAVLLLAQKMRDEAEERAKQAQRRARVQREAKRVEAEGRDSASECGSEDDWAPAERDATGLHVVSWWSASRQALAAAPMDWSLEQSLVGCTVRLRDARDGGNRAARVQRWVPLKRRFKVLFARGGAKWVDLHAEAARVLVLWNAGAEAPAGLPGMDAWGAAAGAGSEEGGGEPEGVPPEGCVWSPFAQLPHRAWGTGAKAKASGSGQAAGGGGAQGHGAGWEEQGGYGQGTADGSGWVYDPSTGGYYGPDGSYAPPQQDQGQGYYAPDGSYVAPQQGQGYYGQQYGYGQGYGYGQDWGGYGADGGYAEGGLDGQQQQQYPAQGEAYAGEGGSQEGGAVGAGGEASEGGTLPPS